MSVTSFLLAKIDRILAPLESEHPSVDEFDRAMRSIVEQFQSASELRALGPNGLLDLLHLLESGALTGPRRAASLYALGVIADPRALPLLARVLSSEQEQPSGELTMAIAAAGRMEDEALFAPLCHCLRSERATIREVTIEPLLRCAPSLAEAVEALLILEGDGELEVRSALVRGLAAASQAVEPTMARTEELPRVLDKRVEQLMLATLSEPSDEMIDLAFGYLEPRLRQRDDLLARIQQISWRRARAREVVIDLLLPLEDPEAIALLERLLARRPKAGYRARILERFAELGWPQLLHHLVDALSDPHSRHMALTAIARFKDPAALPAVATMFELPPDPLDLISSVTAAAIDAVVQIGGEAAMALLLDQLAHNHAPVRRRVAEALGELALPQALSRIEQRLREEPDSAVRAALAQSSGQLRQLAGRSGELLALRQRLATGEEKEIAATLKRLEASEIEALAEEIIALIDHPKAPVRKAATQAIARRSDHEARRELVWQLIERLAGHDNSALLYAVNALALLAPLASAEQSALLRPRLIALLDHYHQPLRKAVERTLKALGVEAKESDWEKERVALRQQLSLANMGVAKAKAPTAEAIPLLRSLVSPPDEKSWCLAVQALAALGAGPETLEEEAVWLAAIGRSMSEPKLELLVELMQQPLGAEGGCDAAAHLMPPLIAKGEAAQPHLINALRIYRYRDAAIAALAESSSWELAQIAPLLEENSTVAGPAATLLARSGRRDALELLIEQAHRSGHSSLIRPLGESGSPDVIPALTPFLEHEISGTRLNAIKALIALGCLEAMPVLLASARRYADAVGAAAAHGLLELGWQGRNHSDQIQIAIQLRDIEQLRRFGDEALVAIGDYLERFTGWGESPQPLLALWAERADSRSLQGVLNVAGLVETPFWNKQIEPLLLQQAPAAIAHAAHAIWHAEQTPREETQRRCARLLARSAPAEAFDLLIELVAKDDREVCRYAAEGLGQLADRHAVAALTRLLERPDPTLQKAAVEALGRIGDPSAMSAIQALQGSAGAALDKAISQAITQLGDGAA